MIEYCTSCGTIVFESNLRCCNCSDLRIKSPSKSPCEVLYGSDPFPTKKVDMTLLPFDALSEVAKVMQFGCTKHGRGSWKTLNYDYQYLLAKTYRHLGDWGMGKDKDDESDVTQLAHAACNIMFLIYYQLHNLGVDNRNE